MSAIVKTLILKAMFSNPAFKYMVGGIAVSVLSRVANKLLDKYPSITEFVLESLDTVEEKLTEFNNGTLMVKSETQKSIEA